MKLIVASAVLVSSLGLVSAATADSSKLTASVRIGATLVDNDAIDNDFSISNFGSRLIWTGDKDIGNGLTGIGRLEFGLNPDENARGNSGIDRTRQLWAGVQGGFGTVRVGAQYSAFYDLISANTDIAWWGSCWTQFECARDTRVLKYNGNSGDISYAASITADPDDDGNDALDEFELGVNYALSGYKFGAAVTTRADEGADGGTLVGLLAKGPAGPVNLALTYQLADEDFAVAADDVSHITLSGTYGNFYAVYNQTDTGSNDPFYGTLGYTYNIGKDTLMYFEYQLIDDDTDADSESIVRATFKHDWTLLQNGG